MFRLGILLMVGLAAAFGPPAPPSSTTNRWSQDPAPQKHLFVDGEKIASLNGSNSIGLVYHQASPAGPVLLPTEPWESFGYIGYHSLVKVGPAEYRMYYDTGCVNEAATDFFRYTCLATSTDGISWTKPNLGVSTFNGSTANNIVCICSRGLLSTLHSHLSNIYYIVLIGKAASSVTSSFC